jgi:hypothetical protein
MGKSTKRPKAHATGAPSTLLAAGKRLGAAFKARDKAIIGKLTSRDYCHIDAAGRVHAKQDVLRDLDALVSRGRETGTTITVYGRVATITGRRRTAGKPDVFALHVWVREKTGWRLLISHANVIAGRDTPKQQHLHVPRPADAVPPHCRNPLETVPYQPKSAAERAVITAFQTMENAVVHNDAREWVKWVADRFVVYRTGQHRTTKAGRVAFIKAQHKVNAETWVAEIKWMKVWIHGDAAVMRADHAMPENRRPPYRATRIWVRRDRRWQMAVSQQTTIA